MDLQELIDRQQIADVITAYTLAVDTKNFGDAIACFTQDAVLDYTRVGGPSSGPAEALAWVAEGLSGFERWQHVLGQVAITITGDTATARAWFVNPMVLKARDGKERVVDTGGYYLHDLVRHEGGWRSSHMVDDVQWMRGF